MRGFELADLFVDAAVSGSVPIEDRPEGARMLARLKPGDQVITVKLDRMFRSARDALNTLDSLKKRGVSLHMLDMGGDVTGNGVSRLMFTILSAVAEMERDRASERMRDAKAELRRQGRYAGGNVPFGWRVDPVTRQLERSTRDAALLADLQADRRAGLSFHAIGRARGIDAKTVWRILKSAENAPA
jgi:DNA invertase Pin-like site-specific DNA recombinase